MWLDPGPVFAAPCRGRFGLCSQKALGSRGSYPGIWDPGPELRARASVPYSPRVTRPPRDSDLEARSPKPGSRSSGLGARALRSGCGVLRGPCECCESRVTPVLRKPLFVPHHARTYLSLFATPSASCGDRCEARTGGDGRLFFVSGAPPWALTPVLVPVAPLPRGLGATKGWTVMRGGCVRLRRSLVAAFAVEGLVRAVASLSSALGDARPRRLAGHRGAPNVRSSP